MKLAITIALCLFSYASQAQQWSVPAKSAEKQFGDVVYLETVCNSSDQSKTDTLPGTGFLLTKDSVVYVVTTKHQILAALNSKASKPFWVGRTTGNVRSLIPLALKQSGKRNYLLLDKQDIAIVFLKKSSLNFILKFGGRPIPADSLDSSNLHLSKDTIFITAYQSFYNNFIRKVMCGLSPGKLTSYNVSSPTFTIDHFTLVSFCGSPVFKNDQIIGMLTHPAGSSSTTALLKNQYQKAKSATAVKAKYITALLNKLPPR